jgi:soluble lytic murein transglycosylase-like protein
VTRFAAFLALVLALPAVAPRVAHAETYKLVAPDGTVHFTNAPTDPRYRRMGLKSGTERGWLKLPAVAVEGGGYWEMIRAAADRYGVPEQLVSAVIRVESGFNPRAVSVKGAQGLMQLMPTTASVLGVRNSFDPVENIEGGVRHLRGLLERFGYNVPLAVAAYNAGEQAVMRYGGIPPYAETRDYVTRVMGLLGASATNPAAETYRTTDADGTITYTNIPPRSRR